MRDRWTFTVIAIVALSASAAAFGQEGSREQSCCKGRRGGGPHGGMMQGDHQEDMELFHFLLDNRDEIRRTVKVLDDGVETVTESDDPEIAAKIREHVRSMERRLVEGRPIHRRDPLFDEIFKHADEIEMTMTDTDTGLKVRETSSNPYVAKLIQSHAEVVSQFLVNGRSEMRKNHPLPERD